MLERAHMLDPYGREIMTNLGGHWQEEGNLQLARSYYARRVRRRCSSTSRCNGECGLADVLSCSELAPAKSSMSSLAPVEDRVAAEQTLRSDRSAHASRLGSLSLSVETTTIRSVARQPLLADYLVLTKHQAQTSPLVSCSDVVQRDAGRVQAIKSDDSLEVRSTIMLPPIIDSEQGVARDKQSLEDGVSVCVVVMISLWRARCTCTRGSSSTVDGCWRVMFWKFRP